MSGAAPLSAGGLGHPFDDRFSPQRNWGDTCWLAVALHLFRLAGMLASADPCGPPVLGRAAGPLECGDASDCALLPLRGFCLTGGGAEAAHRAHEGLVGGGGLEEEESYQLRRFNGGGGQPRAGEPALALSGIASIARRHTASLFARRVWEERHCWTGVVRRVTRLCDGVTHTDTAPAPGLVVAPGVILTLVVAVEDPQGVPRTSVAEMVERTFRPWPEDAEHFHHWRMAGAEREITHHCVTVTRLAAAVPERALIQLARRAGFETQAPAHPAGAEWLDLDGLGAGVDSPGGPSHRLRAAVMWVGGVCSRRAARAGHYFLVVRGNGGWYTLEDSAGLSSVAPYHDTAPGGGPFDPASGAHATILLYEREPLPERTAVATAAVEALRAAASAAHQRMLTRGTALAAARQLVEDPDVSFAPHTDGWAGRLQGFGAGGALAGEDRDGVLDEGGESAGEDSDVVFDGTADAPHDRAAERGLERAREDWRQRGFAVWVAQQPTAPAGADPDEICSVCQARHVDPIALGCRHIFCRGCVVDLGRLQEEPAPAAGAAPGWRATLLCPYCRGRTEVLFLPAGHGPGGGGDGQGGSEGGPPDEGASSGSAGDGVGAAGTPSALAGEPGRTGAGGGGGGAEADVSLEREPSPARRRAPAAERERHAGPPLQLRPSDLDLTPAHLQGRWVCPVVRGCRMGGPRNPHYHEHNPALFTTALGRARAVADRWESEGGGVRAGEGWDRRIRLAWTAINQARAQVVAQHLRAWHRNPGATVTAEIEHTFGVVACPRCHGFYQSAARLAQHLHPPHGGACQATGLPGLGTARGPQFGLALVAARAGVAAGRGRGGRAGGRGRAPQGGRGGRGGATGRADEGARADAEGRRADGRGARGGRGGGGRSPGGEAGGVAGGGGRGTGFWGRRRFA